MYYNQEQMAILRKDYNEFMNSMLSSIHSEREKYRLASKALDVGKITVFAGSFALLTAGTIAFTNNPQISIYPGIKLGISAAVSAGVGIGIIEKFNVNNLKHNIKFKLATLDQFYDVFSNAKMNAQDDESLKKYVNYFNQLLQTSESSLSETVLKNMFGITLNVQSNHNEWKQNLEKYKLMIKFEKNLRSGFTKLNKDSYNYYMTNYGGYNNFGGYESSNDGPKL